MTTLAEITLRLQRLYSRKFGSKELVHIIQESGKVKIYHVTHLYTCMSVEWNGNSFFSTELCIIYPFKIYLHYFYANHHLIILAYSNSLGLALVNFRISEINRGTTCFFLMHIKIAMNIINMGVRISDQRDSDY